MSSQQPHQLEVSVIMPVLNGADHIAESIRSVTQQTFENWELIVSDDGSTDETREIVLKLAENDKRVRLVSGVTSAGPGAARNRGMDNAGGRWLAFLDSDDLWLPEKLEITLKFAKEAQNGLTCTAYQKLRLPGGLVGGVVTPPDTISYRKLLLSNVINTSTVLIDRELHPNFRWSETEKPEDYVAWLEILRNGGVARGLAEPLTIYRVRPGSESSNKYKLALQVLRLFIRVERLSPVEVLWYYANYAVRGTAKRIRR